MFKSSRMAKAGFIQAIVGILLCLAITIIPVPKASAEEIPGMPMILYGIVYHNGSAISSGYTVEARIDGAIVASTTTAAAGKYGYGTTLEVTSTFGTTINFYINGVKATTTAAYVGGAKNLDINVSGTVPATYTAPSVNVTITTSSLANGVVGTAYGYTLAATGGSGTYTWTSTGSLPDGVSLSTAGALSGTPTSAATYSFTVTATDTASHTANKTFSITITSASSSSTSVSISTSSLSSGVVGTSYSRTLTATGGSGSYTWVSDDTLPGGLSLSSAGVLSGTPATAGNYTVTVTATDGNSVSGTKSFSFYVAAAATSSSSSSGSSSSSSSGTSSTGSSSSSGTSTSSTTGSSSSQPSTVASASLAAFAMSDMKASPISSKSGNQVNITVRVANNGKTEGIKPLTLKINDKVEAQQEVLLAPGESKVITFTVNKDTPGTYKASIDPLSTDFAITSAPATQQSSNPGIPVEGIFMGGGLLVLLVLVIIVYKRRQG